MSWIWSKSESRENRWVCFVRDFELEEQSDKGILMIAVDTKYWLYVNENLVVFEGGIKRGPGYQQTYYDEIDITDYLVTGKNRIAILVWYFGRSGFSHCSSGHGGLYVKGQFGDDTIESDQTWYVLDHPSYVEAEEADIKPNFRLAEPNIYYNAEKEIGEWWKKAYSISSWNKAVVVGKDYWGKLVERGIPQWKNFGLKEYENATEWYGKSLEADYTIELKLPYNMQFTPYFDIEVPRGKRIDIYTDTYDTIFPDQKNTKSIYYTKEGRQEYESLGWMNGEIVYYRFPAGTVIHCLQYRETGYCTEFVGDFCCKDAFFNKLYEKSRRTLYVTMRDTFMDCPDRERVQWWGDVNLEMQMMFYCMDERALLLYEKGVRSMAAWAEHYGHMITVVPSGTEQFELPLQNLAGIYGFYYYYERTKNREIIEIAYPMSRDYVLSYQFDDKNRVLHKEGSWDWVDWGENEDVDIMENAWVVLAAKSCFNMAKVLGYEKEAEEFQAVIERIKGSFYENFWTGSAFYNNTKNGRPDDRANALAVLAGLVHKEDWKKLLKIFETTYNASPYMEKYVLDAVCEMGYLKEALQRIKIRYKEMVEDSGTTLWEYWNKDGTRNHAWSGGPLIILKKYEQQVEKLINSKMV